MKNLLTTLKILSAVLIIVLFNDSVNSQNVISSVNANKSIEILSKNLNTQNQEIVLHRKSENWMSNKNYLDLANSQLSLSEFLITKEIVYEEEKGIENWMLDDSRWLIKTDNQNDVPGEEGIELEEWMFDENFWQIKTEEKIPIEDWMLDSDFWIIVN